MYATIEEKGGDLDVLVSFHPRGGKIYEGKGIRAAKPWTSFLWTAG